MQRSILASVGVLTAFLFLVSPALANRDDDGDQDVFSSKMICAAPVTNGTGSATIFNNGDLQVKIRGLKPNATYTCRIFCGIAGLFADAACTTNAKGKLDTVVPGLGRSGTLANGCGEPGVSVFNFVDTFCATGYGSPL
jgi:hypothetical protein